MIILIIIPFDIGITDSEGTNTFPVRLAISEESGILKAFRDIPYRFEAFLAVAVAVVAVAFLLFGFALQPLLLLSLLSIRLSAISFLKEVNHGHHRRRCHHCQHHHYRHNDIIPEPHLFLQKQNKKQINYHHHLHHLHHYNNIKHNYLNLQFAHNNNNNNILSTCPQKSDRKDRDHPSKKKKDSRLKFSLPRGLISKLAKAVFHIGSIRFILGTPRTVAASLIASPPSPPSSFFHSSVSQPLSNGLGNPDLRFPLAITFTDREDPSLSWEGRGNNPDHHYQKQNDQKQKKEIRKISGSSGDSYPPRGEIGTRNHGKKNLKRNNSERNINSGSRSNTTNFTKRSQFSSSSRPVTGVCNASSHNSFLIPYSLSPESIKAPVCASPFKYWRPYSSIASSSSADFSNKQPDMAPAATSSSSPKREANILVTENLEKPLLDDRQYRVIRLPNKVEALLVHDSQTDKSSAALDVRVGSMCDDVELPGQAHAVEHVLFLGTEKYPGENDYMAYLAHHSGSSNAYTSSLSTNYYFEIGHQNLHGALDRFSQFFIAPLFDPNGLDRELNAVDSEHKKNIQQDVYRNYQLSKALSNPKHPWSKFSTGNLETLRDEPRSRGVDVRERFVKFHERYYSGNLMKLVVLGREPLDELEKWVVELFSDIKNKDLPTPSFEGHPLTENELKKQYYSKPVMETRSLTYTFPFLDEEPLYDTQPSRYIGHLIGHEGPGSILSVLRTAGLATSLSAGQMRICGGCGVFQVSIRLTTAGIKKVPEITALLFRYIHILRTTPPQEWVVKELMAMTEVEFKYKQKSTNAGSFASGMANTMQQELPREFLLSDNKIRKFDAAVIKEALEFFHPERFRLAVTTPELPDGLKWTDKERWYGTEYTMEDIPKTDMEMFKAAFEGKKIPNFDINIDGPEGLFLPHPNPFIPTNFEVVRKEITLKQKVPALVRHTQDIRLWFKKDDTFWAPKANVYFTLRTPRVYSTPRDYAISRMFCELVKDALHEYSYDAEIAGLYYHLAPNMLGFDLEIGGYNDKMSVLLVKVLQAMKDLEVKEGRWEVLKEKLVRAYRNWELGTPYLMVPEFMRWLLAEKKWLNDEVLVELESLNSVDEVRDWWNGIRKFEVEGLVHGNLYKEDALNLLNQIQSIIKPITLPRSQFFVRRCVLLPEASNYTYERDLKDTKNVNNAIEYMLHLGSNENREMKARLLLWSQITHERAFDQLRTKEQLGYVVFTGTLMQSTTMGYRVLIQSERSCEYLEKRIEAFLALDWELTDEEFEKHKQSVLTKLLESLKNLNQESSRLWWHVGSEQYDFLQIDHDVENIKNLTREDMREFYNTYISAKSPRRAKLSVHLKSVARKNTSDVGQAANEQIFQAVTQFLGTAVTPPPTVEDVQKRFGSVDLRSSEALTAEVTAYLKEKGVKEDAIKGIVEQGKVAMDQLLPQLQAMEADPGNARDDPSRVYIDDVNAWKSGMMLSRGPKPARDLTEMEETEAKL